MKKKTTAKKELRKVAVATRDAVVVAAARVETLRKKTVILAAEANKRWKASKPRRQKATGELKKAAQHAVAFGKDVGEGLKEGFATVRKGKKS